MQMDADLSDILLEKCHSAPLIPTILPSHPFFFISFVLALVLLHGRRPDLATVLYGTLQRLKLLGPVH